MCSRRSRASDFARFWKSLRLQGEVRTLAGLCGLVLLLLSGCDVLGLGKNDGSGPYLEGIPGKIVYSAPVERESDGGPQIFVTDQEGTRQLTSLDTPYGHAATPAWSPDGDRIAFGWDPHGTGREELYVMQADGSGKRPLIGELPNGRRVYGTHPAWSPSGGRVAFQRCTTCDLGGIARRQIIVADLESGTEDTLTDRSSDDVAPTWSPDGEQIAFISDRAYVDSVENRGDTDLYVMDADGSNVQRLTDHGKAGKPRWGADGDKIAYAYLETNAQPFVYEMAKRESRALETGFTDKIHIFPVAWSPDGNQLLLTAGDYPDLQLYVLKDGAEKTESVFSEPVNLRDADWHAE